MQDNTPRDETIWAQAIKLMHRANGIMDAAQEIAYTEQFVNVAQQLQSPMTHQKRFIRKAYTRLGQLHQQQGNNEVALSHYFQAIQYNIYQTQAYLDATSLCIQLKKFDQAFDISKKAVELFPESDEMLAQQVTVHVNRLLAQQRYQHAVALAQKAYETYPAEKTLLTLLTQTMPDKLNALGQDIAQIEASIDSGHQEIAQSLLPTKHVLRDGTDYFNYARQLNTKGIYVAAIPLLEKSVKLNKVECQTGMSQKTCFVNGSLARLRLAQNYAQASDFKKAAKWLETVDLEKMTPYDSNQLFAANVYFELGDNNRAKSHIENIKPSSNHFARAQHMLHEATHIPHPREVHKTHPFFTKVAHILKESIDQYHAGNKAKYQELFTKADQMVINECPDGQEDYCNMMLSQTYIHLATTHLKAEEYEQARALLLRIKPEHDSYTIAQQMLAGYKGYDQQRFYNSVYDATLFSFFKGLSMTAAVDGVKALTTWLTGKKQYADYAAMSLNLVLLYAAFSADADAAFLTMYFSGSRLLGAPESLANSYGNMAAYAVPVLRSQSWHEAGINLSRACFYTAGHWGYFGLKWLASELKEVAGYGDQHTHRPRMILVAHQRARMRHVAEDPMPHAQGAQGASQQDRFVRR